MVGITTSGFLQYNGYTFDGSASITARVEPVEDESKRFTMYHKVTLNVKFTVAAASASASSTTDYYLTALRFLLSQRGAPLIMRNLGFGNDVAINAPGGTFDVKYGPIPRVISWTPVGYTKACDVEWEVTFHTMLCDLSTTYGYRGGNKVMGISYTVDFNVDDRGLSTRTIAGSIDIVVTRNGRQPMETADQYRDWIQPSPPYNYKRTSQWNTSLDRTKLSFTIVDTQIASRNPLPLKMVNATGRHRVSWSRGNSGAMTLRNTLSMELEPMMGVHPTEALFTFNAILKKRVDEAKKLQKAVLIDEISIEEDLFGTSHAFSASYRILASLTDLVLATGLWQPIVDTSWAAWAGSILPARRHRGISELSYLPGSDVIVDLCVGNAGTGSPVDGKLPFEQKKPYTAIKNETPPQKQSWLKYDMTTTPYRSQPVSRQAIVQESQQDTNVGDMSSGTGWMADRTNATPDVLQVGGAPRYGAMLVGNAMRAGYPIPRPALKTIGGQTPTEEFSRFACKIVGNYFGVPVYAAKWAIGYALPSAPGVVNPEPNLEGSFGESTT